MMLEGTHAEGLGSTGRPDSCRGEHRSPAGFCTAAKLHGRTMFAPTVRLKPPLCKGRWHGVSRDGGIVILWRQVDFLARSQSPTAYRRSPTGPGPSVAARHLSILWGVTPQGEPLKPCRGEQCSPGEFGGGARLPGRVWVCWVVSVRPQSLSQLR